MSHFSSKRRCMLVAAPGLLTSLHSLARASGEYRVKDVQVYHLPVLIAELPLHAELQHSAQEGGTLLSWQGRAIGFVSAGYDPHSRWFALRSARDEDRRLLFFAKEVKLSA